MVPLPASSAANVNKTNPWPITYQWFGFYEDGSLATMGASDYKPMISKELEEVFSAPSLKSSRFKYAFDPSGFVRVTTPDSPEYEEVWGVNVNTKEMKLGELYSRKHPKLRTGRVVRNLVLAEAMKEEMALTESDVRTFWES